MNKNEFLDDIKDIQPDAIITLGNEFFMGRVLKAVTGRYKNNPSPNKIIFYL